LDHPLSAYRADRGGGHAEIRVQDGKDPHGYTNTGGCLLAAPKKWEDHWAVHARTFGYLSAKKAASKHRVTVKRGYSQWGDPLTILRKADKRAGSKGVRARLERDAVRYYDDEEGLDHRFFVPDLFYSLAIHTYDDELMIPRAEREDGTKVYALIPTKFRPIATEWVGIDLDGFAEAPFTNDGLQRAGEEMSAWLADHPWFTGEMAVVRTSMHGVQMIARLEHQVDPHKFYGSPEVQATLKKVDSVALEAVRRAGWEGGHVDGSVHDAARLFRRPGPRIDKAEQPYVSRLVWSTP